MTEASNRLVPGNYFLQPGFIYLATQPTVISTVVGSCVAVCVFDSKKKVGGMNHFQFPHIRDVRYATARYGNVAVSALIRMMIDEGSKPRHLEAQVMGGAYQPEISPRNIGQDNIRVAKSVLAKNGIRIVSEDVGGNKGRKIVFNTSTSELVVVKVDKLRQDDWYPYETN